MIFKGLFWIWEGVHWISCNDEFCSNLRQKYKLPRIPYGVSITIATLLTILLILCFPILIIIGACVVALFK